MIYLERTKKTRKRIEKYFVVGLCQELDSIKEWNEETFPDATLGWHSFQNLKKNMKNIFQQKSQEEERKELADIFIVLGGLRRWESKIGNCIVNTMVEKSPFQSFLNYCQA